MKEEPHKKWDLPKKCIMEKKFHSARQIPVGMCRRKGNKHYILIDKVIMPMDTCPHCRSKNTFHARMNKRRTDRNFIGNVYDTKAIQEGDGNLGFFKFDFCFSCSKKFLIEAFFWKRMFQVK